MYVGLTLVYLGVAGTQAQVGPLFLLPVLLAYIDRGVIPVEERRLLQVFGEDYREYCARVRRWL
jgi:protein-S-isoprenylcysteine O-methyltransferase Ste14